MKRRDLVRLVTGKGRAPVMRFRGTAEWDGAQDAPTAIRLEVKCHRCETQASIPLDAIRRPRDIPIWLRRL